MSQPVVLIAALSPQEGAGKGYQTPATGRSAERQEHDGSSRAAFEVLNEASPARAYAAVVSRSDAESCSKSTTENNCGNDAEKDSDAASLPWRSSAGSIPPPDKGCAELKQSQAPHVHGRNKKALSPRATGGDLTRLDSSLLESTYRTDNVSSPSLKSCEKQHLQPEEASNTISMPTGTPSDADSGRKLKKAQHDQDAPGGQQSDDTASFAEGTGAHKEPSAAGSTSSHSAQTHDAGQIATEHLLQEPILQDLQESTTAVSSCGCSRAVSDSLTQPIRDHEQKQMTEQSHQEGNHADGVRQQQRQIAFPLDLAIALFMVVGLTAVLACGLAMLAFTYMPTKSRL